MDDMLYVAMTGAKQTMQAQTVNANNLANAGTNGFRADLLAANSLLVEGPGFASRINSTSEIAGWNLEPGPMQNTGRQLDVAIQGSGWFAVQGPEGEETYTRNGDLRLAPGGILQNSAGQTVLGETGPVAVAPFEKIEIGVDGSVSIVPLGQTADTLAIVDRIRLVNPAPADLIKGDDGLFRARDGITAQPDASVRLASGMLEGSNVSAIESLISMLDLARHFELQVKLMETADNNAATAAQLTRFG